MLRTALFISVITGGSMLFENLELLSRERAWLLCAVIASGLMFLIPERGNRRDPVDLIFGLVCVIATYAIFIKLRPWLAVSIGGPLAAVVTILLFVAFAVGFFLLSAKRGNTKTNATF